MASFSSMFDNPAASLLHPYPGLFAVTQVHVLNTLGPVYAGKSFLNPFLKSKFSAIFAVHSESARRPSTEKAACFTVTVVERVHLFLQCVF